MYVDFAGDKLYISDSNTGNKIPVEVFAAILPCSQITYYEAVPSQKKEYLIQACENAFHYFGGVPNAIVPDNLKSAVTKPGGIEPVIMMTLLHLQTITDVLSFRQEFANPKTRLWLKMP